VLVLEAGKQFGGYTNPFRRGRYRFDPGVHYIGECGPGQQFTRLLESLDLADAVRFRELSPDGFDRLVFPGYEVAMPRGAERYHERLARDFPSERRGLERFFALLHEFRGAVAALNRIRGVTTLLGAARHVPFLLRYGRATYQQLLEPLIRDPLLRAVLSAQGGDYGLPPSRASALVGLGLIDHYLGGAYFPVGGSGALRDAFVRGIERAGGELLRNRPVERILVERGRVAGVRCKGGEEHRADIVVSNADAAITYRDLVGAEHIGLRLRRKTAATRYSLGSLCLFIGTDLDPATAGMTDANIWRYGGVDFDRFYDPLLRGELPPEDFYFLSSPSLKDPDEAATGHHTLELVTLVPHQPFARWIGMKSMKRGADYEALKDALADRFLAAVERHVPGVRGRVRVLEVGTPATNVSYAAAPLGAIYGPEQSPDQMGPWRYATKGAIPGLFLCGASTLGAGIVPSAISGALAGKQAAGSAARRTSRTPASRPRASRGG
jgi:phytoene dehydrogenase-like protein